jgi:hypothetical protein
MEAQSPEFKPQSHQKKKKERKKKEVLAVWCIILIPYMFFRNWVMTWIGSCPLMNTCDVTEPQQGQACWCPRHWLCSWLSDRVCLNGCFTQSCGFRSLV